ncbi:glycosyltransferase [Allobranchiibius sp. CTAmp26]|uniref:glycosyltransferase n=1 Tax=Allobranchiibius sp. CTAmp26 TaxID=2815214 RepID=UPI001AA16214|nr:glycosyltransferase [Allobranchiibius sp. CTAmp26]MBO1755607.1 glycosyltransferase [Allobranchiibius sp. CTAmp26]
MTALLVVRGGHTDGLDRPAFLDATCAALVEQTRPPDRLVVVDATADRMMRGYVDDHERLRDAYPQVSVVVVPRHASFAAMVDTAVDALPAPGEDLVVARRAGGRAGRRPVRPRDRTHWLWLLHEDSAPDPAALAQLTAVVAQSERVGIAGCKVVDAADPTLLLDIGTDVTRAGRHVGAATRETDQGQHDHRRDVLSVSSAGMLVRQDTYNTLGGFDPAFDGEGDGLDLGWRAHLIGHSVVVVPAARVRQVASDAGRDATTLRRHRQVALARASLLGMPFLAIWTMLSSLLLALVLLLGKQPRRAGIELVQAGAPLGILRILGARGRFFRRGTTRRRNLRGLFVPAAGAVRAAYDGLRDGTGGRSRSPWGSGTVAAETGPVPADAEELRVERGPVARSLLGPAGLLVLLLAVASGVLWRDLLTSGALTGTGRGLAGGQLLPFDTDATGIWRTYRDAWVGPGLGHAGTNAPYLLVLAPLAWLVGLLPWVDHDVSGAVAVAWLLVAAMPLSGLVAYRAGRAATAARWPRVAVAVLWATLPTLTTAVAQGRLGAVVGHILLPFALAGALAAVRRHASGAMTFGAVLAVTLTGAFSPVLLIACSVVAFAGVVLAPGAGRLRALAVLVVPWVLLAPWTRDVLTGDRRALLAGPGALDPTRGGGIPAWELALLHPGGAGSYAVLAAVPVLAIGLIGLLRTGLGRAGAALIGVGLLGLAAALAAPHVLLAATSQGDATPWSGPALDVYAFALLGAGLLGIAGLDDGRWRPWVRTIAAVACVGACVVGGFAVWTATASDLVPAVGALPPVVQRQLTTSHAPRAILLTAASNDAVTYQLIGRETGLPARDLRSPDPSYDTRTASTVSALTSTGAGGRANSSRLMHQLAVGYVVVRGSAAVERLNAPLAATAGLTQLSGNRAMSVWRVEPAATAAGDVGSSRLVIAQGGRPVTEIASRAQHGRTDVTVPAGQPGRTLVLAEGRGWADHGRVTFDGRVLSASTSANQPTYALPTSGGHLVVEAGVRHEWLAWMQLGLLILVLYLAIPFGARGARAEQGSGS